MALHCEFVEKVNHYNECGVRVSASVGVRVSVRVALFIDTHYDGFERCAYGLRCSSKYTPTVVVHQHLAYSTFFYSQLGRTINLYP